MCQRPCGQRKRASASAPHAGKRLRGASGAVKALIENRIRELRGQGMGQLKIARTIGCGVSVVQRVIAG